MLVIFAACNNSGDDKDTDDKTPGTSAPADTGSNDTGDDTTPPETGTSMDTLSLSDILAAVKAGSGIEFGRMFQEHEVPSDELPFILGCETFTLPYKEAYALSPMMTTSAFQLVLFRLEQGSDVKAFAEAVKTSANPNKWICVSAEAVTYAIRDNTILFVMTKPAADADSLVNAFNKIDPANFNPDDYIETAPLDGKTMNEAYNLANEYTGFFNGENAVELNADTAAAAGFAAIDIAAVSDSAIDYNLSGENLYVCGFFRIFADANPNYFAYELGTTFDSSVLGENVYSVIMTYNDVVVIYSTTEINNSADFLMLMENNLGLTEYVIPVE